jgi:hypothetical protein
MRDMKQIRELQAEAKEAREFAATLQDRQASSDMLRYAIALEREILTLQRNIDDSKEHIQAIKLPNMLVHSTDHVKGWLRLWHRIFAERSELTRQR